MASSLSNLKQEVKNLKAVFGQQHSRFKISGGLDELTCVFVINNEKSVEFKVNVPDNYPSNQAIWFSDSEDESIVNILESLTNSEDSTLSSQIKTLLTEFCGIFSCSMLHEIQQLTDPLAVEENDEDSDSGAGDEEECAGALIRFDDAGPDADAQRMIHKADEKQLQNNLRGWKLGSVVATNRLKKELLSVCQPAERKNFTLNLVNDSLYEWNVRLLLQFIDPDSLLYQDLKFIKECTGEEGVLLHLKFEDTYPYEPPFIRVVEPIILGGQVQDGAMCMELLVKQGWKPAYCMKAVLVEVASSLALNNGRVNFSAAKSEYTLERAQMGFQMLQIMPDQIRWTSKAHDG